MLNLNSLFLVCTISILPSFIDATRWPFKITKISNDFALFTKEQDQLNYATSFAIVNTAQDPKLHYIKCFLDDEELFPLSSDPHSRSSQQLISQMESLSLHTDYSYKFYRIPHLSKSGPHTLIVAGQTEKDETKYAQTFRVPLIVEQMFVSYVFHIRHPVAKIIKDEITKKA